MMEAVHRYEGTVNQVIGDGIMALFGAPLAHEDHAVRACYAALEMGDSVTRYAGELRRPSDVPNGLHRPRPTWPGHLLGAIPLAEVSLATGRIEDAARIGTQALELARKHQQRGHEVYVLRLLGDVAARREPSDMHAAEAL
jgi:hypothetical protein